MNSIFHFNNSFPLVSDRNRNCLRNFWITPEVTSARNIIQFVYQWCRIYPTENNKLILKQSKHKYKYNSLLISTRRNVNEIKLNNSDNVARTVWKVINQEIGRGTKTTVSPLNLNPNDLNFFFVNYAGSLIQSLPFSSVSVNEFMCRGRRIGHSFFFRAVDEHDISAILKNVKNKKRKKR